MELLLSSLEVFSTSPIAHRQPSRIHSCPTFSKMSMLSWKRPHGSLRAGTRSGCQLQEQTGQTFGLHHTPLCSPSTAPQFSYYCPLLTTMALAHQNLRHSSQLFTASRRRANMMCQHNGESNEMCLQTRPLPALNTAGQVLCGTVEPRASCIKVKLVYQPLIQHIRGLQQQLVTN